MILDCWCVLVETLQSFPQLTTQFPATLADKTFVMPDDVHRSHADSAFSEKLQLAMCEEKGEQGPSMWRWRPTPCVKKGWARTEYVEMATNTVPVRPHDMNYNVYRSIIIVILEYRGDIIATTFFKLQPQICDKKYKFNWEKLRIGTGNVIKLGFISIWLGGLAAMGSGIPPYKCRAWQPHNG